MPAHGQLVTTKSDELLEVGEAIQEEPLQKDARVAKNFCNVTQHQCGLEHGQTDNSDLSI